MKHDNSTIVVKNQEGTTVSIRLDKQTAISRDNKKVAASELRVGPSLVIDAYGDTADDCSSHNDASTSVYTSE